MQVAAQQAGGGADLGSPTSGTRPREGPTASSASRSATSAASIGWKLVAAGTGTTGSRARPRATRRTSWWNWVARRIVQGSPEVWISRSAWSLAW
jgi:hypothetical protein